jgi:hypothetical protein
MVFENVQVTDSLTMELGAEEGTGVAPDVAVCIEDSVAKELEIRQSRTPLKKWNRKKVLWREDGR